MLRRARLGPLRGGALTCLPPHLPPGGSTPPGLGDPRGGEYNCRGAAGAFGCRCICSWKRLVTRTSESPFLKKLPAISRKSGELLKCSVIFAQFLTSGTREPLLPSYL